MTKTSCPSAFAVSRRDALRGLATAAVGAGLSRPAAAALQDFVVVGKDGWLFAVFDEVRQFEMGRFRTVTQGINDAVAVLKHAGIETVISLTPAKSRVYREFLPADFQFIPEVEKRYDMARDILTKPGTLVPDLSAVMLGLRKANPQVDYFLKADTHWTGDGAEPCAIEIAKQINAKLHLPPSSKPGTQLGPVITAKQSNNDLADGLPDAQAAKYGPQSYHIHQVVQSGGAGLLDDDAADVLLVGNSYMQPKYGFAPMLSNQLGRPVSLVWKVHQSSPYKTLLSALSSDKVRNQRPKLLVWDFEETDMVSLTDQQDVWGPNVIKSDVFLTQLRSTVGV